MGLFKKRETVINIDAIDDILLKALIQGNSVTREQAMSIPAVSSAVDFICNTFAIIPFKLYEESVANNQ